jgi:hypothetical protein
MDLAVCPPLLMHILSDHLLVPILAHGIRVESAGPELSVPEHLLDFGMGMEDLLCGDALDRLNYRGGRHCGNTLHEKMDMVFVSPYLDEMNLMTLRYPLAHIFESHLHCVRKNLSSILGRAHYVVEKERLVMPLENMFTHTSMLAHMGVAGNAFTKKATPQRSCEESVD